MSVPIRLIGRSPGHINSPITFSATSAQSLSIVAQFLPLIPESLETFGHSLPTLAPINRAASFNHLSLLVPRINAHRDISFSPIIIG
jgi:hypothetical protein